MLVLIGFGIIFATAMVQLVTPSVEWIRIEESLAPVATTTGNQPCRSSDYTP